MTQKAETILNYRFENDELFRQAFTHSSHVHEKKLDSLQSNERLEFLGDAVLQIVVSDYLYSNFTQMHEGDLTKLRASVVCESSLATAAKNMDIGSLLILGRGEKRTGGDYRDSILADTFEAVIGAVYLDGGYEPAEKIILDALVDSIHHLSKDVAPRDYKTRLQEQMQKTSSLPLKYTTVEEKGPAHKKIFKVHLEHNGKMLGTGIGKSKKEAEQQAAKAALDS